MTGPEAHAAALELEHLANHLDTLRDRQSNATTCQPLTDAYSHSQNEARRRAAELRTTYPSATPTSFEVEGYISAYLKATGWRVDQSTTNWKHSSGGMRWGIGGAFQRAREHEETERRRRSRESR